MTDTLQSLSPDVRSELVEVAIEVLDGMLEAIGAPAPPVAGDGPVIESRLDIIGGSSRCEFAIRMSTPAALGLTAALTGESVDDLEADDARSTCAELSNVLAGSVKTLFDAESSLDVPHTSVVEAGDLEPLDTVPVHHPLVVLDIHLGEPRPGESAAASREGAPS